MPEEKINKVSSGLCFFAALLGLTAVGAGAFGAHGLRDVLEPRAMAGFETAVRYQMYHALALWAVAWVRSKRPSSAATASAVCMIAGVTVFCGSLYGLILLGWRWLGAVTPIGGVLLMIGWLLLAVASLPARRRNP